MRKKLPIPKIQCHICKEQVTKSDLSSHLEKNHPNKVKQCPKCGIFKYEDIFERHISRCEAIPIVKPKVDSQKRSNKKKKKKRIKIYLHQFSIDKSTIVYRTEIAVFKIRAPKISNELLKCKQDIKERYQKPYIYITGNFEKFRKTVLSMVDFCHKKMIEEAKREKFLRKKNINLLVWNFTVSNGRIKYKFKNKNAIYISNQLISRNAFNVKEVKKILELYYPKPLYFEIEKGALLKSEENKILHIIFNEFPILKQKYEDGIKEKEEAKALELRLKKEQEEKIRIEHERLKKEEEEKKRIERERLKKIKREREEKERKEREYKINNGYREDNDWDNVKFDDGFINYLHNGNWYEIESKSSNSIFNDYKHLFGNLEFKYSFELKEGVPFLFDIKNNGYKIIEKAILTEDLSDYDFGDICYRLNKLVYNDDEQAKAFSYINHYCKNIYFDYLMSISEKKVFLIEEKINHASAWYYDYRTSLLFTVKYDGKVFWIWETQSSGNATYVFKCTSQNNDEDNIKEDLKNFLISPVENKRQQLISSNSLFRNKVKLFRVFHKEDDRKTKRWFRELDNIISSK